MALRHVSNLLHRRRFYRQFKLLRFRRPHRTRISVVKGRVRRRSPADQEAAQQAASITAPLRSRLRMQELHLPHLLIHLLSIITIITIIGPHTHLRVRPTIGVLIQLCQCQCQQSTTAPMRARRLITSQDGGRKLKTVAFGFGLLHCSSLGIGRKDPWVYDCLLVYVYFNFACGLLYVFPLPPCFPLPLIGQ
jgi:hypothetical protein